MDDRTLIDGASGGLRMTDIGQDTHAAQGTAGGVGGQSALANLPKVALSPKRPLHGEPEVLDQDKRLKRPRSKRSGGPRTENGVASSSKNSVKHGAYALHQPQTDAYHEKLSAVIDELNPHGVISRTLCRDIAHGLTKLEAINAYERLQLHKVEHDDVSLGELVRRLDFPWAETHLDALCTPIQPHALKLQVHLVWERLALQPCDATKADRLSGPDLRVASIYKQGCELLAHPGLSEFEHGLFLNKLDVVMLEARHGLSYLGRRLAKAKETSTLVSYWLFRNHARIQDCINSIKTERMIEVLTDERLVRASAQVQRGLKEGLTSIKAVRELRSQA